MITEKAYAKINLFLNVTARRSDGYHDIESIMHSVDLHDVISIEVKKSDKAKITVETNSDELSEEKNNLVYIAAEKYITKYSITDEITILHKKNIPIGAGLGGGSSDAAATLRALNKLYKKCDARELTELSSSIGSDVPFCLLGGTAHCLGRGEKLSHLAVKEPMFLAIAIGDERVSTPRAFASLDISYADKGFPDKGDRCLGMIAALSAGEDVSSYVYNIFEDVTDIADVEKIKKEMIKNGAECALMSGSGPSVFGVFKTKAQAEATVSCLSALGFSAFSSVSVNESNLSFG